MIAGALRRSDNRVSLLLVTGVLLLGGIAALWPLLVVLHGQWTDVALYRHGYLLAAMAGWLAWKNFHPPPAQMAPDWRYGVATASLVGALLLLDLLYLNVPRIFLLPPLIVALAGTVFGHAVARRLFWPGMLLYGALPVWPALIGTLQSATTATVSWALSVSGVPAFIDGNFVYLPAGVFEIAEGCAGTKYLIVSVSIAMFYALAFVPTWRKRALLVAVAAAGAIVTNWIRVYVIILAGHLTDMQHYLVSVEHRTFGWLLFGIFLVPLMLFSLRLSRSDAAHAAPRTDGRIAIAGSVLPAALVAVGMLAAGRIGGAILSAPQTDAAGWEIAGADQAETDVGVSAWRPVFAGAKEQRQTFELNGLTIEAYRALYPMQTADRRLVAYGNSFVPEEWEPRTRRVREASLGGSPIAIIDLEGTINGTRRIVWGWYLVAGEPVVHPLTAKILELKGILSGRRDAAAVAVSVECPVDCTEARRMLGHRLEHSEDLILWVAPT